MRVLGLESSCDETCAAVVDVTDAATGRPRGRVLSDVVHTQADIHARFGGVVPELASRDHLQRLLPVLDEALARADTTLEAIDGISVTRGPGLVGALLVGVQVAKSLALALAKPLVGVNHLEGHLLAVMLSDDAPEPPFLGLVVSGGHTSLYEVSAIGTYRALGHTLDDAAGEAFDKVAKLLGLPYPGGAHVDRLAREGDPAAHRFPRGLSRRRRDVFDFSFSGLKTAVATEVAGKIPQGQALADLCASFQEAVCDALTLRAVRAARHANLHRLVVCGGVAANSRLRALALERCTAEGIELFLPAPKLCTDNGAMIAMAGAPHLARGDLAPELLSADPGWRL